MVFDQIVLSYPQVTTMYTHLQLLPEIRELTCAAYKLGAQDHLGSSARSDRALLDIASAHHAPTARPKRIASLAEWLIGSRSFLMRPHNMLYLLHTVSSSQ